MNSPAADPEVLLQSPIRSLFTGRVPEDLLFPYPEVSAEERETVSTFLDSFRGFARTHIDSRRVEKEHGFSEDVMRGLAELGAFGMIVPEAYGGYGFSTSAYCRVMEEIGTTDASLGILIGGHQSIGMKGLVLFGTEEQKAKWLPALAAGEMIAAFALTEPEAGSDAASIKTHGRVRRKDGHVRLERHQALDLQRRLREVLHGLRPRRPARRGGRPPRDHGVRRHPGPRGRRARPGRAEARIEGFVDRADHAHQRARAGLPRPRRPGPGLQDRRRDLEHRADLARRRLHRRLEGHDPPGGAACDTAAAVPDAHRRFRDGPGEIRPHGRQHVRAGGDGVPDRRSRRPRPAGLLARGGLLQGLRHRERLADDQRRAADRRRQRLHGGVPVRARAARLAHQHDLRGHQRDPARPRGAVGDARRGRGSPGDRAGDEGAADLVRRPLGLRRPQDPGLRVAGAAREGGAGAPEGGRGGLQVRRGRGGSGRNAACASTARA